MNEHQTPSILKRVPVILAVTAASYGLAGHAARRPVPVPQLVPGKAHKPATQH